MTVAAGCLLLAGCKTTEKNYQAAYEVAVKKKKSATSEPELGIGEGQLLQTDGPSKRVVGSREFYFERERLKAVDADGDAMRRYCVAVGVYKMKTNCKAQVADLAAKGYKSFVAVDGEGKFYTIAAAFSTLEEAADFAAEYESKEKGAAYIGLPSAPLVIES